MRIAGSGRLTGGKIDDELHISGSVRITEDFECNGFSSSGSTRINGDLTIHGDIRNSGSFRHHGSLYVEGDAKFSGSTSVDGEILVERDLANSGSFRAGNKITVHGDINFSGSTRVQGAIISRKDIIISGSGTIHGNITGVDILIGRERLFKRSIYKHPNKIYGDIISRKDLKLIGTLVDGDVRGYEVVIGPGTEILGTVYYISDIQVHDKAILANDPVKVNIENIEKNKDKFKNYQ